MSHRAAWHEPGLPPWRPLPPPAPIWRARAGVWCGHPDHPREVLERRSGDGIERAIAAWRCSVARCGRKSL